jgi:hypothetical protein
MMEKSEPKRIRSVRVQNDDLPKSVIHWIPLGSLEEVERLMGEQFLAPDPNLEGTEQLNEVNWNFKRVCEDGRFFHVQFKLTEIDYPEEEDE